MLTSILLTNVFVSSLVIFLAYGPVSAALALISAFVNTAFLCILLHLEFLALLILLIYVGAIVVLFLFVIMLLNIKQTAQRETEAFSLAHFLGALVGLQTFLWILGTGTAEWTFLETWAHTLSPTGISTGGLEPGALGNGWTTTPLSTRTWGIQAMTPSEVLTLGFVLYTEGALYFVGAGVLLLVTLLGCVLVIGGGEEDLVQLDPTHPQGSRRPLFV